MRSATRRRGSVIFRTVPRIAPLKFLQQANWKTRWAGMSGPSLPHLARTRQFDASEIALRRRLGQRLASLDHVNPKHLEGLVAGFCVVNGAFRDLIGFACLYFHRRLAVDDELKLPPQHIAGFSARVGMAGPRPPRGGVFHRRGGV